jgi:hypothetical protein
MIKVWLHCLLKTFANIKGEDHRMIRRIEIITLFDNRKITNVRYSCTCEYNK